VPPGWETAQQAELAYVFRMLDDINPIWAAPGGPPPRLGSALLTNGKDAVRQRIKDRTGL
jgi:hypothetical protein